jgi:hypothetical protein
MRVRRLTAQELDLTYARWLAVRTRGRVDHASYRRSRIRGPDRQAAERLGALLPGEPASDQAESR